MYFPIKIPLNPNSLRSVYLPTQHLPLPLKLSFSFHFLTNLYLRLCFRKTKVWYFPLEKLIVRYPLAYSSHANSPNPEPTISSPSRRLQPYVGSSFYDYERIAIKYYDGMDLISGSNLFVLILWWNSFPLNKPQSHIPQFILKLTLIPLFLTNWTPQTLAYLATNIEDYLTHKLLHCRL